MYGEASGVPQLVPLMPKETPVSRTAVRLIAVAFPDRASSKLIHFFPPFQHLLSERLRLSANGGTAGAPLKPLKDDSALNTHLHEHEALSAHIHYLPPSGIYLFTDLW